VVCELRGGNKNAAWNSLPIGRSFQALCENNKPELVRIYPCVEDRTWTRDSSIRHSERTLYTLLLVLFRLILCDHPQGMLFRNMKSNIFHVLHSAVIRTHS